MLTKKQVKFYKTNGFLAVENVLSVDELQELRTVTDEFIEKSRAVATHTDVFDLEPGHTAEQPRLRRLKNPADHHPVYASLLHHTIILDLVSQLIGPYIRYHGQKLNLKYPEYGSAVEWHQDIAFYPHTNDDLLAVGICIDDMTKENGCLLVIPGSHKGPIYDHSQDGMFAGAVTDSNFQPEEFANVELPAGGIVLFHCRLLHASAPNRSVTPRRLLLYQYRALDAWPLLGVSDWGAFNAKILRGNPTNRPRLESVPAFIPLPEAKQQGSIYEIQSSLHEQKMTDN